MLHLRRGLNTRVRAHTHTGWGAFDHTGADDGRVVRERALKSGSAKSSVSVVVPTAQPPNHHLASRLRSPPLPPSSPLTLFPSRMQEPLPLGRVHDAVDGFAQEAA